VPAPRFELARGWMGRVIGFAAVFAVLQLSWQALAGGAIERFVIHDATVVPATWLVNSITPAVHANAVDRTLAAPGGGLNILNGCEGIEALFLLFAAFAVAPLPWRSRCTGFLLGVAVVFIVNQARILTLFYTYRTDPALFDPLHGIVTPIVVVLTVSAYFYLWLIHAGRPFGRDYLHRERSRQPKGQSTNRSRSKFS